MVYKLIKSDIPVISQAEEFTEKTGKFSGLTFCITGALTKPRKTYQDIILDNGAEYKNSITKDMPIS